VGPHTAKRVMPKHGWHGADCRSISGVRYSGFTISYDKQVLALPRHTSIEPPKKLRRELGKKKMRRERRDIHWLENMAFEQEGAGVPALNFIHKFIFTS